MFSIKTYNGQSESGVEDEENATTVSALRHEDVIKSFCTGVNQPIYLVYVTQTLFVFSRAGKMQEGAEDFLLTSVPPSFFYIPDFISEAEETNLLRQIENSPTPRFVQRAAMSKTTSNRWTQLANRRLQNWGGVPHPKGMLAEPLPSWLSPLVSRVAEVEVPASDDKQQR